MSLSSARKRLVLIVVVAVCAVVAFAKFGPASEAKTALSVFLPSLSATNVEATRMFDIAPGSAVNLQLGRQTRTKYTGALALQEAMQTGAAQPRAMVSDDFNGDGMGDLVIGYANHTGGGVLSLRMGNVQAIAPTGEVFQGITEGRYPEPFVPEAGLVALPEVPDFLQVGDFDADGYQDVLAAARGGTALYLIAGNGKGTFGEPQRFEVSGTLTALQAYDSKQPGVFTPLALGLKTAEGTKTLIYNSAGGGLEGSPESYSMPGDVTAFAFGRLDDDTVTDLVAATGSQAIIIHGNATTSRSTAIETENLPFVIKGIATGDFIWDRQHQVEIAALSASGSIHLLAHGSPDTRPYTQSERTLLRQLKRDYTFDKIDMESLTSESNKLIRANRGKRWGVSQTIATGISPALTDSGQALFQRLQSSNLPTDDLLIGDGINNRVRVVKNEQDAARLNITTAEAAPEPNASSVEGTPIAAVSVRLSVDVRPGRVVLMDGQIEPDAIIMAPTAVFTVNSPADLPDDVPTAANGVCHASNGLCTLRAAIMQSNHTGGSNTIMVPDNTYTLTLGPPDDEANTGGALEGSGDLDIFSWNLVDIANGVPPANASPKLTSVSIIGGTRDGCIIQMGILSPILASNTPNNKERILEVNDVAVIGFHDRINVTLTNLTMQNGSSPSSSGSFRPGGAIYYEGSDVANTNIGLLTLTNVKLSANTAVGQGGGVWAGFGSLTVNSSSIVRANVSTNAATGGIAWTGGNTVETQGLTMANSTVGGGLVADGNQANDPIFGAPGGVDARGGLFVTISGTTIQNNIANTTATTIGGGGIQINSPTVAISTSDIINNKSKGNAGGIYSSARNAVTNAASTLTLTTVNVNGNQADSDNTGGGNGGGIFNFFGTAIIQTNSHVDGNSADNGGGIYNAWTGIAADPTAGLTVQSGSTIGQAGAGNGNSAKNNGGSIAIQQTGASIFGPITLDSLTFTNNTANSDSAGGGDGGAIFLSAGTITSLNACTFDSNVANGGTGDAIRQTGGAITGAGTLNFNGGDSISLSGGTFTSTPGTLNLTGNFINSGGTFTHNSGTFVFNGTGAQSLGGSTSSTFNNLTVNKGSGALTLGVNTTVANIGGGGNLSVSAGTFDLSTFTINRAAAGGTLTLGANTLLKIGGTNTLPSNFSTHSFGTTSTVEFAGTNQSIVVPNNSQKYGNLTTSGSGTKTLAGALGAASDLTIGAGTVVAAGANAFNVGGDWINNVGSTGFTSTGTVTFDGGSGTQLLTGSTTFNNLTLNNNGATTDFGNTTTTVGNTFTKSNGAMNGNTSTFIFTGTPGAGNGIKGGGAKSFFNLQINGGANISSEVTAGNNLTVNGSFTNSGTFAQDASLSTTFGGSAQNLTGAGTTTFGGMTVQGTSTVTATNNFSVLGASFSVSSGGTFTGSGNTVSFTGSVAQVIGGAGSKNFAGLTINNANGVSVTNVGSAVDASVSGALTLTTDLTVASGGIVQQSGTSAGAADVVGTVRRTDLLVGTARAFGNPFNKITMDSGTAPTQMDFNLVKAAPAGFPAAILRDYTLSPTGGGVFAATMSLHYQDGAPLNGNTEPELTMWKNVSGTWTVQGRTSNDTVNNAVTLANISSFSEWTLADRPDTTVTSIVADNPTTTNAASVSWTVLFADSITGLSTSNFSLSNTAGPCTGPSITGITGSGTTYQVTANTGSGSCTLRLDLANDTNVSHDVTNEPFTTGASYTIDKLAPSLNSFVRFNPATSPTNADTLIFRATFSEAVIGVDTADFSVNSTTTATVTNVSGSGTQYDVTVSGGDLASFNGSVGLNLAGGQNITDVATNPLPNGEPATDETYTLDNLAPTVDITDVTPDPRNTAVTSVSIVFNEAVTGFDLADLSLTRDGGANLLTGSQTLTSGDNITWVLGNLSTLTTPSGTYVLTLTGPGGIGDTAGNPLASGATSDTWVMDTVVPTVTVAQAAGQNDPTFSNPINYAAVFSEVVTGFDSAADISRTGTATASGGFTVTITNPSSDGKTYNIAIGGATGDGTVIVSVLANAAQDAAGNNNTASTNGDNTVTFVTCLSDPIVTLNTDTNVTGDLRYALANVCTAPNNNVTFNLAADSTITLAGPNNPLVVAKDINITGPSNRLTIDGAGTSRLFTVNPGINALITNLNLTNGQASQSGAIQNDGNLTLIGMSIFGNNSDSDGGAMRNDGTATIVNSTIANNNAKVDGGGILNGVAPKSVILLNSTITGNRADSDGNASGSGGGITNGGASANLRIRNSIVSGNFVGTGSTPDDIAGSVQFANSLVGIATGLSPSLAYNGGPTQNFALQSGSNALDNGADATSLAAAVADGVVTSVTVADGTLTSVGLVIRIDNEQMLVTARSTNTLTVTRGFNATTAVAHSNGAAVNPAFDQRGSGFPRKIRTAVDIGAFEAPVVDLSISKSDGGASVAPGGTVSYTLTYANSGGAVATGVVITETVPANTTFNAGASTAGWVCVPNNNAGSTCTLAIGSVPAASGSLTATFAVTVVNPVGAGVTQISNTASIADDGANGTDLVPGNNSGSDTTPVTGAPDFSITKSDAGASVAPGGTVSYTLTYSNSGNRGATGVVLTETVPANTTFNAGASTAGWVCVPNNNAGSTCTLAIGGLAAGGGNQTATFAVTVVNPVPAGVSQISNTASIADNGANGTDPTPGNNSGSDTTPVTGAPDFSITKSDAGASVAPGGTVSYTLTYSNSGNRGASGVVLTETVPANTTFNAGASTAGWVCVPNNNAGSTCTLAIGGLAAGGGNQTATFAVTVINPVPAGVSQISNTASIADDGANGTDPTPGNNSGSDTTPVTGAPDFSITKSDGGASVAPGGTVSYTLTYANSGNRGASGVVLTETVPANTTFNAGASTAGWVCTPNNNAGSTCTLAIGGLAAGGGNQTATFAVTVVNPVAAGVSQISNTASIADDGANGADPTPGNNSGSDTTPVTAQPDLSITKSDGGVTVVPGGTVSYTLTYSNSGNQGATGVVLTETVPANTTFNAGASTAGWVCTPNNNAGSTCTLAIGGLAAGGGNQTATFAVTLPTTGLSGVTQISNTASIADDGANGTDPTPGNNSGSDTTPVVCQTITVTNPAVTTGAQGNAFSQSFTQTGGNGTVTFTTASPLPAGLTLASNGLLSGTPTQSGTFPIVVTATDANGCTGTGTTYNLVITCVSSGVVINTNDNGPGSLRQAVLEACTGSTVTFSNTTAGGAVNFFDGSQHTIALTSGQITIDRNLTITGPGAGVLTVRNTAAASPTSRVLLVNGGVTAAVSGLTVTGGNPTGDGGGINNSGALTLTNMLITLNSVSTGPNGGGGIINWGTVTITSSTVSGNSAAGFGGGGLLMVNGATAFIDSSTFSGNNSGSGGAILSQSINVASNITIKNSTISGNTSTGFCGGLRNLGGTTTATATITSSTITDNDGQLAGGICNGGNAVANVGNTIIAANRNNGTVPDTIDAYTSQGYNLIGSCPAACSASGFAGPADQTGTLAAPLNPGLNGLGNNGGPTQTHLPQTGSPVIDKGRDFGPIGFDQRGETRQFDIASIPPAPPAGDNSDIGAVEVHNTPPSITAAAPLTRQQGTAAINSQIATVSDPDQAANTLTVTATPASGTGVTVTGIAINPAGAVTANVVASCTATNSTFTLTVTDNAAASNTATLTVNVTANTPPVLTYGTQNVTAGTTPSFNPATGPSDNGTFGAVTLQSVSPNNGGLVVSVNAAGQVSVTSATLIGTYTVTVAVTDNCGATTTVGITVNVTCPTITINPASLPGGTVNTAYNQSVAALPAGGSYTYAVSAGALPAGLSLNPSTGAITGTPATAGPFNFTITATGWGGCTGSQAYSGTITKANTIATIVTDNPDPSVFGQSVTVNYTLVGSPSGATTPTGNVVVTVSGGAETCTGTIAAGTCSLALTAVGARVLTATYAGDSNFNGSSDTENHQVDKANTATAVTSSANPSAFGQNVGFTATVSAAAPGAGTPTGTVTFAIDGVNQPPATLSGGSVTMNTSTLSVGTHTITAQYNGDANFNTSNGALAGGQVVGKANTTTVITNAAALASTASNSGQPYAVNFTVTPAAPGAGTPTGFVSVTDGTDICLGTVASGTCNLTSTTAGVKTITATYLGDPNFNSSSGTATHTVLASISGNIQQFIPPVANLAPEATTPLAGVTVSITGTAPLPASTTTDAAGNYSFGGLTLGGNYTVTPTMAGKSFEPLSRSYTNLTANVTNADFLAFAPTVPRELKEVNAFTFPGQPAVMQIVLNGLGNEKTWMFSLNFNINHLAAPTVTCGTSDPGCTIATDTSQPGKIGITVTPATQLAAGPRNIATVTFQTFLSEPPNTPVTFGDAPTPRLTTDANGNPLQTAYTNGFVVFGGGYEGDVAGRPNGSGEAPPANAVTTTDITQVALFVAGTNTVGDQSTNEFQRADCAPSGLKGDGALNSSDIVQVARFAAGLDGAPPSGAGVPAGGPFGPLPAPPPLPRTERSDNGGETAKAPRTMRVVSTTASPGGDVAVTVELDSRGDEVASSFTLNFDPARLTISGLSSPEANPDVSVGADAPAGTGVVVNAAKAARGQIGIVVFNSSLVPFSRATGRQMVTLNFHVTRDAESGPIPITFGDSEDTPTKRSLSDGNANPLKSTYTDGEVNIIGTNAPRSSISGRVRAQAGPKNVRFHDGRQTAITTLAENGTPDWVIQAQVGHVDPQMMKTYSHIRRKALNEAAAALDPRLLQSPKGFPHQPSETPLIG